VRGGRRGLISRNDALTYPDSLYAATAAPALASPVLAGELACDVCVIGGGYTGLSAALHLAELVAGTAERFDLLAAIPQRPFPGGAALRGLVLSLGFLYVWLMDRLRM